jgi:hypothetical protein
MDMRRFGPVVLASLVLPLVLVERGSSLQGSRSLASALDERVTTGEPGFEFSDGSGMRHIAFRLLEGDPEVITAAAAGSRAPDPWKRCSVIYTLSGDAVVASDFVGVACLGHKRSGRVRKQAIGLQGATLKDVLMKFGAPDSGEVPDGAGTLVYDYGVSESTTDPVSGSKELNDRLRVGVVLSVGIRIGCRVTFLIEDGRVSGVEPKGGVCRAAPL